MGGLLCGTFVGVVELCRINSPTMLLCDQFYKDHNLDNKYLTLIDQGIGGILSSLFLDIFYLNKKGIGGGGKFYRLLSGTILGISSGLLENGLIQMESYIKNKFINTDNSNMKAN